jgi:uncharacterized protein with PIN domain
MYCTKKDLPMFAMQRCTKCNKDIFDGEKGYSEEYSKTMLITGCPHCNRSFVD